MSGNAGIQPPRTGEASTSNRLDSWKEIAAYIKRDVRTVQRWEKQEGLPVHRLQHDAQGTVFAYRSEIEAWWRSRQNDSDDHPPIRRLVRLKRSTGLITASLLCAALLGGMLLSRGRGKTSPRSFRALAILPLQNLSGDPTKEYFVDAMTEELITELSRLQGVRVISRTSAMHYKGTNKKLPEIARELNVDAVVEGSALLADGRVRITAQLIQADDDQNLWADSYDRELKDVLSIQQDIARAIANEMKSRILVLRNNRMSQSLVTNIRPVNPEAQDEYFKGSYHRNKGSVEEIREAIGHFDRAVAKDPSYSAAYAGLAQAYSSLIESSGISASGVLPGETGTKAKAAALRAIELDENLADAHASLGWVNEHEWDWSGAEVEYKRATELSPNDTTAHIDYADFLGRQARFGEATREARIAGQLDPLTAAASSKMGDIYLWARQYDLAKQQYEKTLNLDPNFADAHGGLGYVYFAKRMYSQALDEWHRCAKLIGDKEGIAFVERLQDHTSSDFEHSWARESLSTDLRMAKTMYLPPTNVARDYAQLGDKDRAFEWLERAYREHDWEIGMILKIDPAFDDLRSDPRFRDLLRRVGLPQ